MTSSDNPLYFHSEIISELLIFLKSDSHLPKKEKHYWLQRKPFKNDKKCFLFHLKSSFPSQNI